MFIQDHNKILDKKEQIFCNDGAQEFSPSLYHENDILNKKIIGLFTKSVANSCRIKTSKSFLLRSKSGLAICSSAGHF